MRRLIFPENPNNSMIPPVKLILSGEVYYLSTSRQMFIKAIGQRALNDIRGDLIFLKFLNQIPPVFLNTINNWK